MRNYKIAVAGTGYVGLSLGVLLSQHHQVVAVDIVQAKVDMINNKKSPIQDDYIEKYLAEKDLDLTATLDAKAASIHVVAFDGDGRAEIGIAHFNSAAGFLIHPVQIGFCVRDFGTDFKNVCTDGIC